MTAISNVHVREIAAPAAAVGEILATLGSADDRLWATDIWVTTPVMFDRPLAVGAEGGHGSIRYSVVEYEPGRRIVFEFSPDGGLSGTHGFELEALAPDRCRLRHFLEAETSRWMRPIMPILIGYHERQRTASGWLGQGDGGTGRGNRHRTPTLTGSLGTVVERGLYYLWSWRHGELNPAVERSL